MGASTNALSTSMKIIKNHNDCATYRSQNDPFCDLTEEQKGGLKPGFEGRHKSLTNASKVNKPKETHSIDEFIKLNPIKYRKFKDSLKQKFLIHSEVYGKPNVLVNN